MSKFCPKCFVSVTDNDARCSNCGTTIKVAKEADYGYPNKATAPKSKNIMFVFINSLIFMIFFAIRCVSTLFAMVTWQNTKSILENSTNFGGSTKAQLEVVDNLILGIGFSIVAVFLTFALVLTLVILVSKAKNAPSAKVGLKIATPALVITILALVSGVVYALSEALMLFELVNTMGMFPTIFGTEDILVSQIQYMGTFVFDAAFIIFFVLNIVKVCAYKKEKRAAALKETSLNNEG